MATYLLFAGHEYYPEGGMGDLIGAYASEDEARAAFVPKDHDWAHIAEVGDGITARIIAKYRYDNYAEWGRTEPSQAFPLGQYFGIGPIVPGGWDASDE